MKILFDGTTLCALDGGPGAGIEHYTRSILQALVEVGQQDNFFVTVPSHCSPQLLRSLTQKTQNVSIFPQRLPTLPFVTKQVLQPLKAGFVRPDIYFSPYGQLPLFWHGRSSCITIHDVSIFDHPEFFSDEMVKSFATRHVVPASIERATQIICVSQFTQSRLHQLFSGSKKKTTVIYEGVELGNFKNVEHVSHIPYDREYVLCLGTIEPRKNLVHGFRAFERLLSTHPELAKSVRLIVAGKYGWKTTETEEAAATINHAWKSEEPDGVIRFLGAVTEEEKWYLLSRAAGLLFPSYEEGFGLPILEAMSVGTPVILSRGSALEEVAGDTAMLIDPEDVVGMSLAIAQCLFVPEGLQSMREEGYLRAKQFSWNETAKQTLTFLKQ